MLPALKARAHALLPCPFSSTRYFHRRFQVRLCFSLFPSALALPPTLSSPTSSSFPVYIGPSAAVSKSGSLSSSFAWHFRRRFQFLFLLCCTSRTSRTSAWVVVIWRIPHLERVPFARVCSGKTPSSHYTLVSVSDSISAIASDWVSR